MKLGSFALNVSEGREVEGGYVEIAHGTVYSVELVNNTYVETDVELKIDGKTIGVFRLYPYGKSTIQRGLNERGRFTFYRAETKEAAAAELGNVTKDDLGLVQATFYPAKEKIATPLKATKSSRRFGPSGQNACGEMLCSCSMDFAAGGTGLSGNSNQEFINVKDIDRDHSRTTMISLRLIEPKNDVRPLRGYYQANPIPKPV